MPYPPHLPLDRHRPLLSLRRRAALALALFGLLAAGCGGPLVNRETTGSPATLVPKSCPTPVGATFKRCTKPGAPTLTPAPALTLPAQPGPQ